MTTLPGTPRPKQLAELADRNRAALRYLHEAAQAISDGETKYARRLQRQAERALRPRWGRLLP